MWIKDLIVLVSFHFLGDFVLQNNFLANNKGKNMYILLVHSWLWSFCILVGFELIGKSISVYDFLSLVLIHSFVDLCKARRNSAEKYSKFYLYIDQLIHFLQIWFIYL